MNARAQSLYLRWILVIGFGLLLGTSLFTGPDAALGQSPDSVILIIADDLGVDALDLYGVGDLGASTPTLDRLAEEGVRFQNAWAHPVCSPFRAAVLTGRQGFRTGVGQVVTERSNALPEAETTIPEALDAQPELGAAHAAFGKWHLGNASNGGLQSPNLAGFDHYAGALGTIDMGPPNNGPYSYYRWRKTTDGQTRLVERYAPSDTVDDAAAWLEGRSEPFFLYLPMHLPHTPFHAPPAALHSVDLPAAEPAQGEDAKPYFRAMIEAFDSEIGRLLDGLTAEQRARTSIIFVGDNGTGGRVTSGPIPRGRAKGTLYQGGLHVPLIIAGPAVVEPGREVEALAGSVDIFGTVLDLMGADEAAWLGRTDAISLAPYLRDPAQAPLRDWVFSEQFNVEASSEQDGKAIRDARFKYLRFDNGEEALYDLLADPQELTELISAGPDAEAAAALDRLRAELDRLLASSLPSTPEAPTPGGTETAVVETATPEAPTPGIDPTVPVETPTPGAMPRNYLPALERQG